MGVAAVAMDGAMVVQTTASALGVEFNTPNCQVSQADVMLPPVR